MNELLMRLAWDVVLVVGVGVLLSIWMRRWINEAVAARWREHLQAREKQLAAAPKSTERLFVDRNAVHAEVLELVYRLRNQYRDIISKCDSATNAGRTGAMFSGQLGEELPTLAANLPRFRTALEPALFEMVQQFQRELQDAQVMLNRITRPTKDGKTSTTDVLAEHAARYRESSDLLKGILVSIDRLYHGIAERTQRTGKPA